MIHARNLRTNETIELDPKHPVILVGPPTREWGQFMSGQTCRKPTTPDSVSALSWATEFPDIHAFVLTDEPYNESDSPIMLEAHVGERVWVRCSLHLL